jgi:hypothetical protein
MERADARRGVNRFSGFVELTALIGTSPRIGVHRAKGAKPAFYVSVLADESDQPAREGAFALGTVEL